jgi:hypothetical protein
VYAVSVIMANWPVNQCVFAVQTFFRIKSILQTGIIFRPESEVLMPGEIPQRDTILHMMNDQYEEFYIL